MEKQEHTFSWQALIRIIVMGIIVFLGWKVLSIFPIILIAFVLAATFHPAARWMQKKTKMPLIFCLFLVLVVPLVPIVVLGFSLIPRLVSQIPSLFTSIQTSISRFTTLPHFVQNFNFISYAQSHLDYAATTVNIALTVASIITTIVLTFFLLYDFEKLLELFLHVVPEKEQTKVKELLEEVSIVTGKYIRGNVFISAICGVVLFIGLSLLHVPFALPLAIFAAVLDLLPLVGQTIGAIPAVIIGFGVSPLTGFLVVILHLIYQQIENAIISPVIYNKALNLYPSVSFLSVLIGGALFGILGAFLALPVAASIPAIMQYQKNYIQRHQGA